MEIIKKTIIFLESLKREHHINHSDCWYSCPKSGEGCYPNKTECDCGADDMNQRIDEHIKKIEGRE